MTFDEAKRIFEDLERTNELTARDVDALLATAASRLLNSAALLNHMRHLRAQGRMNDYWTVAVTVGHHLTVAGHSITTAHNKLLGPAAAAQQNGGPVN